MNAYYSYLSAHHCTESKLDAAREPAWDYLRETCPSLTPMDCNAQFSEIFTTNVFCDLNALEKSKVISVFSSIGFCDRCNQHVISNSEVFVNHISLLQLNAPECANFPLAQCTDFV